MAYLFSVRDLKNNYYGELLNAAIIFAVEYSLIG